MNIKRFVTFSSDDGSREDLRFFDLLNAYNLKGTFYVPRNFHLKKLTDQEIKRISEVQEIGGHTINHQTLTDLPFAKQKEEIFDSKDYLEQLTCKKIDVMSYPYGPYDNQVVSLVEEAGYIGARTVEIGPFESSTSFELKISLQIYPFPLRKRKANQYLWGRFLLQPLGRYRGTVLKYLPLSSFLSWQKLARNMFDYIDIHGGALHVWGHGWEIEKYDMWEEAEEFFKYISGKDNVFYVTNGGLVKELFYKDQDIKHQRNNYETI